MTRSARNRTRDMGKHKGISISTPSSGVTYVDTDFGPLTRETMSDFVGRPVGESNLTHNKYDLSNLRGLTGGSGDPYSPGGWFVSNAYHDRFDNPSDMCRWSGIDPGVPSPASMAATLYARSNPNRPDINVLSLVQDLASIPGMIKEAGDFLRNRSKIPASRQAANQYLGFNFGWVPLFKDLDLILTASQRVSQRNDELKQLGSSSGLKRRLKLGEWSSESTSGSQFWASGFPYNHWGVISTRSKWKMWGVVKWIPSNISYYRLSDSERLSLARRIVSGATASGIFAGAWDNLPWTFLLDWVVNVKDYVLAHGNTVPCSVENACIMRHDEHKSDIITTTKPSQASGGEGTTTWTANNRTVLGNPGLSVNPPYLTTDRLATLMALAIQRKSRIGATIR